MITINGQPLPSDAEGSVSFSPTSKDQGKPSSAPIAGGKYDCDTVPMGNVRATFNIYRLGAEYTSGRGEKARETINLVPPAAATGVDVQVTGDKPDQDFDLK
jgi:hypothetical protein